MDDLAVNKNAAKQIMAKFGLRPDKGLGQNFLIDDVVLAKIVAAAEIQPGDTVLEVGPGLGALTQALLAAGANVTTVELDRRLLPALNELKNRYPALTVINQDILKLDPKSVFGSVPFKVVANLPYYITTPIIMHFLEQGFLYERLVVMVQKEVAERMAAEPGGRDYGALSVAVQYRTEATLAFTVPAESFLPPPNVESAVIVCKKRLTPPVTVESEDRFFQVVKAAFSQRRKVISNSLKNIGLTGEQTAAWLAAAGIDGRRRAETLSLAEFAFLENSFDKW